MGKIFELGLSLGSPRRQWSNRLLLLSIAGILFLTLLPFRFNFHPPSLTHSPFLLEGWWAKGSSLFDAFLNVLLFVPFGFGVSAKLREKHVSKLGMFFASLFLGALLSYTVEFTQIYIPSRDSGWGDIVTNGSGSAVGFFVFELCGALILDILSAAEVFLEKLLVWPRFAVVISLYLLLWFGLSIFFQHQTRLTRWDRFPLLLVGNDASSLYLAGWQGAVDAVQWWDHPLSTEAVQQMAAGNRADSQPALLADYDFSGPLPLGDRINFLPPLSLISKPGKAEFRESAEHSNSYLSGDNWLTSRVPVTNLVLALQRTSQFALRVLCRPRSSSENRAAILSLSTPSGFDDLEIVQDDSDLAFWFENDVTTNRYNMEWYLKDVFRADRTLDVVFSYDGNTLSAYINGQKQSPSYPLGPGLGLARHFRHVKTFELDGYEYIYYSLIFFIAGSLAGISCRNIRRGNMGAVVSLSLLFLLPALLLEAILVLVSGKFFSWGYVALSVILTLGGAAWISADGMPAAFPPQKTP